MMGREEKGHYFYQSLFEYFYCAHITFIIMETLNKNI